MTNIPASYIASMAELGYQVVQGAAVKGDVVAVKLDFPFGRVSALTLNSKEAAHEFNHNINSTDWLVFRKSSS